MDLLFTPPPNFQEVPKSPIRNDIGFCIYIFLSQFFLAPWEAGAGGRGGYVLGRTQLSCCNGDPKMEWLWTDGILSFSHIAAQAKSNPKLLKGTPPSVFSVDALPSVMLVLWPKWLLQLLTSPLHLGAAGKVDGKKDTCSFLLRGYLKITSFPLTRHWSELSHMVLSDSKETGNYCLYRN